MGAFGFHDYKKKGGREGSISYSFAYHEEGFVILLQQANLTVIFSLFSLYLTVCASSYGASSYYFAKINRTIQINLALQIKTFWNYRLVYKLLWFIIEVKMKNQISALFISLLCYNARKIA